MGCKIVFFVALVRPVGCGQPSGRLAVLKALTQTIDLRLEQHHVWVMTLRWHTYMTFKGSERALDIRP